MGVRHKAREYALQALYLLDITDRDADQIFKEVTVLHHKEKGIMDFARHLFDLTLRHKSEIDEKIVSVAKNWDLKRMAALDRNILRMGIAELLYEKDTPISVVINEAINLAKEFSTIDSGKFVNGILDKLKKERSES